MNTPLRWATRLAVTAAAFIAFGTATAAADDTNIAADITNTVNICGVGITIGGAADTNCATGPSEPGEPAAAPAPEPLPAPAVVEPVVDTVTAVVAEPVTTAAAAANNAAPTPLPAPAPAPAVPVPVPAVDGIHADVTNTVNICGVNVAVGGEAHTDCRNNNAEAEHPGGDSTTGLDITNTVDICGVGVAVGGDAHTDCENRVSGVGVNDSIIGVDTTVDICGVGVGIGDTAATDCTGVAGVTEQNPDNNTGPPEGTLVQQPGGPDTFDPESFETTPFTPTLEEQPAPEPGPAPEPERAAPQLATTGSTTGTLALIAALLIAAGAVLRRRTT